MLLYFHVGNIYIDRFGLLVEKIQDIKQKIEENNKLEAKKKRKKKRRKMMYLQTLNHIIKVRIKQQQIKQI